jgi:hypothetical protein
LRNPSQALTGVGQGFLETDIKIITPRMPGYAFLSNKIRLNALYIFVLQFSTDGTDLS